MISEILRTMQGFDLVRHRCCGRLGGFAPSIRGFRKVISSVYIFQKLHVCLSWNIVLTKPRGFRHMKDSDRTQTMKWRERPIIFPKCCICLHACHAHLVPKIMTFSKNTACRNPYRPCHCSNHLLILIDEWFIWRFSCVSWMLSCLCVLLQEINSMCCCTGRYLQCFSLSTAKLSKLLFVLRPPPRWTRRATR